MGAAMMPQLYQDAKWLGRQMGKGLRRARKTKTRRSNKRRKTAYTPVGEPMKDIHMKREQVIAIDTTTLATRTLYTQNLTQTGFGTAEDDRSRHLINCKGIQIAFHFNNKLSTPVFLNCAVIAPKHGTSSVGTTDFFRGTDGTRGMDFDNANNALEHHYTPINTDKYVVIRHGRYQLGSERDRAGEYNADTGNGNWLSRKMWIPVNRQLRYEDTGTTSCSTPIFFAYWADNMDAAGAATPIADQVGCSFMHTMFYTDVL